MKTIELTKGQTCILDDIDYDYIVSFGKWQASKCVNGFYAFKTFELDGSTRKNRKSKGLHIHKLIMESVCGPIPKKGYEVDHINRDTLDNRRENLRVVTISQGRANRAKKKIGWSKYKGVRFDKNRTKWRAVLTVDYRVINIGSFVLESDAAKAYNEAAVKYFGEYACLNVIDEK